MLLHDGLLVARPRFRYAKFRLGCSVAGFNQRNKRIPKTAFGKTNSEGRPMHRTIIRLVTAVFALLDVQIAVGGVIFPPAPEYAPGTGLPYSGNSITVLPTRA